MPTDTTQPNAVQSAPQWDDLVGDVVARLGFDIRRSPTLMKTVDRGVRYVDVDPSGRQIVFSAKALVLGLIAVGREDLDSIRFGNSATWFYEWFKGKASDEGIGRVLGNRKTDPDEIFPLYEDGGAVAVSPDVAALVPVAAGISQALSGRPELEARHFFTAMVEEGLLGRQLAALFDFNVANSLDELKRNLIERMLTQPDTGETLAKWLKAFSIPESEAARFSQQARGAGAETGGPETADGFVPPIPSTVNLRRIAHAVLGNDSPEAASLDDQLGIKDEALAFARIAAARETVPPLAFGVFGEWGSGKSFFIRLMQRYVDELAGAEGKKQSSLFHSQIVQIRFNAWHYVESNLWASLVEHIFAELDTWSRRRPADGTQLLGTLATARELTLQAAERLVAQRQKQKSAAERLAAAERELTVRREQAGGTPRAFWKAVKDSFADEVGPTRLKAAADELGLSGLADNAEALRDVLDDVRNDTRRVEVLWKGFRTRVSKTPSLLILLAIIVVAPTIFYYLNTVVFAGPTRGWLADYIKGWMTAGAGLLASLAGFAAIVKAKVRSGLETLEGYRDKLDSAIESQLEKPKDDVRLEEQRLAQLTAEIVEAKAVLAASSAHLAEAMHNYESDGGRQRLLRFVRERAGADGYGKHLGLIHAIRKDFTQLSALMSAVDADVEDDVRKQRADYARRLEALIAAAGEDGLKADERRDLEKLATLPKAGDIEKFDRIVLYIDDLDRCPPEQVVQVLQAVHLLLSFPLFFVVVAVDTRWVIRALDNHYGGLLDDTANGSASASDYLEKIFQIPYWVRSMSAQNSQSFVRSLLRPKPKAPVPVLSGAPLDPRAAPGAVTGQSTAGPGPQRNDQHDIAPNGDNREGPAAAAPLVSQPDDSVGQALTLTRQEQLFMQRIAPWTGDTPRRALRFVNTYRVIKACLAGDQLQRLEDRDYRFLMVELAIVIGSPGSAAQWSQLIAGTPPDAPIAAMLEEAASQKLGPAVGAMLEEVAKEPGSAPMTAGDFGRYWEIAGRYGFKNLKDAGSAAGHQEP